jgi:hypothetical protein
MGPTSKPTPYVSCKVDRMKQKQKMAFMTLVCMWMPRCVHQFKVEVSNLQSI